MRARPLGLRRFASLPLLLASLTIGVARAHDIEVEGEPEDLPGSEHFACEQGLAAGFPCWNVELVEFVPVTEFGGQQTNDLWGWTDRLTGSEYVMIGVRNGTAFFALDDHGHPTLRGTLPTRTSRSAWRDIKVYGNHAFIVSEAGDHGMQVFDLTRLREASDGPMSFTSDAEYTGFGNAHNIAIDEETAFAYAVGTRTCRGGLHMIDIRDPLAPIFAGCFSDDGYTHDAQCVVYHGPDADFVGREICFNANEDTVTIVDVTNKAAPLMLARAPYFSSRYTHQGWLSEDHHYFFLDDELDERSFGTVTRTFVWDVTDLRAPRLTGAHRAQTHSIDHNQYVRGNHLFQANYRAGIRILRMGDLSRAELVEVAFFDTSPEDDLPVFAGTWSVYPYFESGFIVASDINKGLFVLAPDLAAVPECSDGVDNDGDGLRDHPEDPTCVGEDHGSERERLDVTIALGWELSRHRLEHWNRGLARIAILGSETVDAHAVELGSLRLGPGGAAPVDPSRRVRVAGQRFFSGDAFDDRVVKFRLEEAGLTPEDQEVCLQGRIAGDPFRACHPLDEPPPAEGGSIIENRAGGRSGPVETQRATRLTGSASGPLAQKTRVAEARLEALDVLRGGQHVVEEREEPHP